MFAPRKDLLERSQLVVAASINGGGESGAHQLAGEEAALAAPLVTPQSEGQLRLRAGERRGTGQREETGPGVACSPRQMGERKSRRSAGTPGSAGGPVAMNGSVA